MCENRDLVYVKMTVIVIIVILQVCENRDLVYVKMTVIVIIVILQMCENRDLVSPHSHYPWNSQIHSQRSQSFVDAARPTVLKALGIKTSKIVIYFIIEFTV